MAKYRRKVLEVEAVQITDDNVYELPQITNFFENDFNGEHERYCFEFPQRGCVDVYIGDYLVKDVEGNWYPCKQSVFEATYEPITDIYTTPNGSR